VKLYASFTFLDHDIMMCVCVCVCVQGTVLLSPRVELSGGANSCMEFEAELFVLYSTGSGVKPGFQGTVYVASTVQNAMIQQVKSQKVSACSYLPLSTFGILIFIYNLFALKAVI